MVWSKIGKQALEYDSPTVLYSLPPPILVIFFPSYSQDTYLALCSLRLRIQYSNLTIKGCMMCVCLSVCYLLVTDGHRSKQGTRTDGREALRCSS